MYVVLLLLGDKHFLLSLAMSQLILWFIISVCICVDACSLFAINNFMCCDLYLSNNRGADTDGLHLLAPDVVMPRGSRSRKHPLEVLSFLVMLSCYHFKCLPGLFLGRF